MTSGWLITDLQTGWQEDPVTEQEVLYVVGVGTAGVLHQLLNQLGWGGS